MRYAAILLSRQPLRPTGQTPWVRKTVEAVRWIGANQMGLVSSVGLQTWEMATAVAADLAVPLRLVVPATSADLFLLECDRAMDEFGLSPDRVEFVAAPGLNERDLSLSVVRDHRVAEIADLLLPISCRKHGHMSALLDDAQTLGKAINSSFAATAASPGERLKYDPAQQPLSESWLNMGNVYLIHWTRAAGGPWPGEKRLTFYRAVIESETWPRAAFHTLQRIVRTRRLLASPRHMPAHVSTVSFTGLKPRDTLPLMRWRARYRQMSFEPYGIGIRRDLAARFSIEPVEYFDSGQDLDIPEHERWRRQSRGRITDWKAEQEFRHRGDFDLSALSDRDLAIFCRTEQEADQLRRDCGLPVWSMHS